MKLGINILLTALLVGVNIAGGFYFGIVYQKGQVKMAEVPDTTALDKCVKITEEQSKVITSCNNSQKTFIQILDDQSEIINSMSDIIWDFPLEDIKALREGPKPKRLNKFGDLTGTPKSVEEILKTPATVPPPVIFPGTNPPVGELY